MPTKIENVKLHDENLHLPPTNAVGRVVCTLRPNFTRLCSFFYFAKHSWSATSDGDYFFSSPSPLRRKLYNKKKRHPAQEWPVARARCAGGCTTKPWPPLQPWSQKTLRKTVAHRLLSHHILTIAPPSFSEAEFVSVHSFVVSKVPTKPKVIRL